MSLRSKADIECERRWDKIRDLVINKRERLKEIEKIIDEKEDYNFGLGEDITYYNSDDENNLKVSAFDPMVRDMDAPWYLIKKGNLLLYRFNIILIVATWLSLI